MVRGRFAKPRLMATSRGIDTLTLRQKSGATSDLKQKVAVELAVRKSTTQNRHLYRDVAKRQGKGI